MSRHSLPRHRPSPRSLAAMAGAAHGLFRTENVFAARGLRARVS